MFSAVKKTSHRGTVSFTQSRKGAKTQRIILKNRVEILSASVFRGKKNSAKLPVHMFSAVKKLNNF